MGLNWSMGLGLHVVLGFLCFSDSPKPHLHLPISVHISHSVESDSATPWTVAGQASWSITNSWSLLKLISIKSVMPSTPLILCCPLLLLLSIFPSIRVFSNESVLCIQFSSVQSLSRVRICDPMNRSTPGLPVHHQLPEFTQTHVHRVSDAIQPSHPLSSPSPPAPNPSQRQSLFQ